MYLWYRRTIGRGIEHEWLSDIKRGESSHYTVPGKVPMCDRKVLYAMRCMYYMLCVACSDFVMYVICMLCMIWAGRHYDVDRKVLYVMRCMFCMICVACSVCVMYVICMLCMIWARRHYDVDRKVRESWTGRSIWVGPEGLLGLGRKSPETHGLEGQGLEGRMCVSSILGNSLSFYAYICCVTCFRY